jgi:hypothetical protein
MRRGNAKSSQSAWDKGREAQQLARNFRGVSFISLVAFISNIAYTKGRIGEKIR